MPLLWLSLAVLLGIFLGAQVAIPPSTWLILAGSALATAIAFGLIKSRLKLPDFKPAWAPDLGAYAPRVPTLLMVMFLFLGAYRYQGSLPDLTDPGFIAAYNDDPAGVVLTGVVVELPDHRDWYTNLRVAAESIRPADGIKHSQVGGIVLAQVPPGGEFHYGDRVALRGELETPPGGEEGEFSYRDYLARQGVYALMPYAQAATLETGQGSRLLRSIYTLKERSLEMVYKLWPDPEAALLAGILLGVESGIPEPVREAFNDTGTSHVIVISGFNITIVAGLFASLFGRWLGRFRGAIAAAIGIALYTLLVGATPAVVRAAIMGGLGLFGYQIGRRQSGLHALSLSAALMAIQNPQILWDVSFQLSFFATLGLVLFSEPMTQAFNKVAARFLAEEQVERLAGPVSEYFLFTFAAQVTTLPLIAYHFGRISLISFAANPLILPVQPPIMVLGGLALGLGLIWHPLGKLAAPLVWPFALFTIRVVEFFAGWQSGVLSLGRISFGWVMVVYLLIFASILLYSRYPEMLSKLKPLPLALALGAAAVIVWRIGFTAPDGLLHMTLLDVGTGDALLIQTPSGRYTLINGGPSSSLLSDGLGRRLPPFPRKLDVLVVASPREAQIAALPGVLERYPPAEALWAGPPSPSRASDRLRETLTELGVPITLAQSGQRLDLGEGAELIVLTSAERGAILSLEWGNFKAILPLGADLNDLESLEMGLAVGEVEALLLADNGYAPINPPEWIANLHPQVVLLSVAADDRDGLPDRVTLETVAGYTLLRTDQNGWIHISTDGKEMWIEAGKGR